MDSGESDVDDLSLIIMTAASESGVTDPPATRRGKSTLIRFYRNTRSPWWKDALVAAGKWVIYAITLIFYITSLTLLSFMFITHEFWDVSSEFGGERSWQFAFENSSLFKFACFGLPILFFILQVIPWCWWLSGHRSTAVGMWSSVVKNQSALGVGSLTIWIALNSQDIGEGLVLRSKVFALALMLTFGSIGTLMTPVLQKIAVEKQSV